MTWTLLLVGILLVALNGPLIAGRIPPNRWYGFRTPRVIADERVWYPVNRMAGVYGAAFGVVLLALVAAGAVGLLGPAMIGGTVAVGAPLMVLAMFVHAARIVAGIDAGGPRIDYRSSFQKTRDHDADKARAKLLDKLKQ
jgi:hypothetical protein